MPSLPPKPCTVCRVLVHDGSERCDAHKRKPWQRSPDIKRVAGRVLQRARDALFSREPLCRECHKHGRATPATKRDHIVPLSQGGTDDDSNIQPLCEDCHDAKTATESAAGRWGGGA